ncbi:hypothetical protein BJ165DRAFT_1527855 [Panaeolus papilionaceus]|nr:hypothetical protein BJ165DRAFT_1527855 [Panaeolus papilionaceus]
MAAERLQLSLAKFRTVFRSLGLAIISLQLLGLPTVITAPNTEDRDSSPLAASLSSRWLGTFTPWGVTHPPSLPLALGGAQGRLRSPIHTYTN